MPTPVSTARQCLTEEAARALDDAVAVARRRSHAQTTSLHAVSALLALPSSTLRDACARARSSAYSPRLQFRALELSVGVSLDRLPSAKAVDEPPVSNSLMAAIKRSQANQRRQPETFHLYQQLQQQNQSSLSCVKVELKHFILSILDDPIVSRVFGEAGFRSCDIKLAILHPPSVSRFSRSRCPPLFLCNLTDSELNHRSFNFPFAGFSGFENVDENCKRIGEVLVNRKGRNPLLIGICAKDALSSFTECVLRGKGGILPAEIDGLSLICMEKEIHDFVAQGGNQDQEMMGMKFKELGNMVECCSGPGIVVNYGELKAFDDDKSADAVSYVISQLSSLLEVQNGKLWLMGAAGSYETYMKFSARFPTIQKDWDLHLLPITSSSSKASAGGLYSKSSLMGSFVPLGGFFSAPSEFKNLSGSTNQSLTRCDLCNEKYEQEVSVVMKGGSTTSVADQYSASLSSWLQIDEGDTSKRMDMLKTKDDATVLSAKLMGLQKKWNDICQRLHCTRPFQPAISQVRSQVPGVQGFQFVVDGKESSSKEASLNESGSKFSFMPMDLQKISPPKPNITASGVSEAENANLQPKLPVEVSKSQQLELASPWPPPYHLRSLNLPDCTSPSSVTSVATELGLGTLYASAAEKPRKNRIQDHKDRPQYFSASVSAEFDGVCENALNHITQSSSCSGTGLGGLLDPKDFKSLWRVLVEKVGWQDEAIYTISQTVSRCRTGDGRRRGSNQKGDIWLSFIGPDKVGKRKIAAALAEIIFGSRESLVAVDLSSEDGISHSNSIFDRQDLSRYDVKFRGKTVVDYIVDELSKKPRSVVLLENVDKADFLVQTSLSQAIRTGKFPDSRGREMGIYDMIFVTTSRIKKVKQNILSGSVHVKFSEERILEAKGWQMQILIGRVAVNANRTDGTNVLVMPSKGASNPVSACKRKLFDTSDSTKQDNICQTPKRAHKASCLDLNLPVEEMEGESNFENCDSDSASESSEAWLEDFFEQLDEKVIFKPFDFDALAAEVLKEISRSLQKNVGSEALLEIDEEVLVQMLAAAWLSDSKRSVEVWINKVLNTSFVEARQRYHLTGHSVLKLVACEGLLMEKQAPGVCLPVRINLQ